jgi:zinc and cadmium transporter
MLQLSTFTWVAIFAVSAAVINTIGILAVYKSKGWAERAKIYLMCFAAGVLISVPLTFALPEAIQNNHYAGFAALIGFLFMFISNMLIQRRTRQQSLAFGITAAEGIGLHSFVDGVIYAVTFSASILVGILSGIGLVLHELAEGVITYSLLISGGVRRERAVWYAFLIAGLTTPIGAFIAYPIVSRLSGSVLGLALGFVVGVLIYISASHLLPEARGHEKKHSMWAFFAGIALALFIVLTKIIH